MAIDGSVHETGTFLGVEKNDFSPDFKEYIQKERLNWSRFQDDHGHTAFEWVFWSQQDHQTQLDNYADLIRHALQRVMISEYKLRWQLVQFWAPTKTAEGRTLLTTQFQPFVLGETFDTDMRNMLCEYRMGMCREYNNSFYADAECPQEQQLGLPARVFLNQSPESTPLVKHYTVEEYPQHDLALRCNIRSSWALPVFHHSTHTCIGVLEIVSIFFIFDGIWHDESFLGELYDIFKEFGLLLFNNGYKHYKMQIGDENKARTTAFQELKMALETVCKIHELPLAMSWVPCSACNDLLQGPKDVDYSGDTTFKLSSFILASESSHLRKRGVARMVLSSRNMLYCSDITQLSLAEYPLVPYARHCKLRGWFTICLQNNYTANDVYVLEFFLPTSERYHDNSWTSLSLILRTMKESFRTFKLASGQELGDLLRVEVIKFQEGQKLHYVQDIQANGGGVMLQLRHPASMGAIHCGTNVVSEDQNGILPSLEAVQNQEVTMRLDSSHQPPLDPPNNGQNIIIEERNIITVTSSEERKRKTQREHKETGVRIEVSLEDILKCVKLKREGAAKELQVSISTFKRVCRHHGINRWPPRNIEKLCSFRPSPIENEGQTRQCLNSGLPSNQASDSVAHIKSAFQDADIVTIKAKYENNTIKFRLPLPYRLVELQQEVANRLINLEAGTYNIRYQDEENDLILIACDQDLKDCIQTFKSPGNTSVVVLLEPK